MMPVWAVFLCAFLAWIAIASLLGHLYQRGVRKAEAAPSVRRDLITPLQSQVNDYFSKQFPGVLDGRPFFVAAAETEPYRFNPYDYWRDLWITTGDLEALEQMTDQVKR